MRVQPALGGGHQRAVEHQDGIGVRLHRLSDIVGLQGTINDCRSMERTLRIGTGVCVNKATAHTASVILPACRLQKTVPQTQPLSRIKTTAWKERERKCVSSKLTTHWFIVSAYNRME